MNFRHSKTDYFKKSHAMKKLLLFTLITVLTTSFTAKECEFLPTNDHLRTGCKMSHQKSSQTFFEWLKDIFTVY